MYKKFIAIKGREGAMTGYFVPKLYQLSWNRHVIKAFGLPYVAARLLGWTIWVTETEDDYVRAIKTLDELKKTRIFRYWVNE